MGQSSSTVKNSPSAEELAQRLTSIFVERCLSSSELQAFKDHFRSSTKEHHTGVDYWTEDTLVQFLQLPETIGSASVYHLCCYFGTFPFAGEAPVILSREALLRAACFMTGRYKRLVQIEEGLWLKEIWHSCAVLGRESSDDSKLCHPAGHEASREPDAAVSLETFNVFEGECQIPKPEAVVDDELARQVFRIMGAEEAFNEWAKIEHQDASIPVDNFRNLLQLLLLLAPVEAQEEYSLHKSELDDEKLRSLRVVANIISRSFGVEHKIGIGYQEFHAVVSKLPHLFDSLGPLFEHFFLPKVSDVHPRKDSTLDQYQTTELLTASQVEPQLLTRGSILDQNLLSQLTFIFSRAAIIHRLRPLYLGHVDGYSMGSFEKIAFKWNHPSILLVSGTLLSQGTKQSHARTFLDDLPHRRLSSSVISRSLPLLPEVEAGTKAGTQVDGERVIYGAYIPVSWQATDRTTFGTEKTSLFQLSPVQDVFPAATSACHDYIYFNKPPATYSGVGFGSPLPSYNSMTTSLGHSGLLRRSSMSSEKGWGANSFPLAGSSTLGLTRRSSLLADEHIPLGPVSLHIDDGLEFGVFTHISSGVGSYQCSTLPMDARSGIGTDWQDRFEIDAIELWGIAHAAAS